MEQLLKNKEAINEDIINLVLAKELDYSFFSVDNVDLDTASDYILNKLIKSKVKELISISEDIYMLELNQ